MVSGGDKPDLDKQCEYTVQREGRQNALVLECGECEDPGSDLNVTRCYRGALNAFQSEVNIDIIMTSHHLEAQYTGPSVEVLGRISGLLKDLADLSKRDPVRDYVKADRKGRYKKLCPACPANPANIFPRLETVLKKNPKEFITVFKKAVDELPGDDRAKECARCRSTTVEELDVAFRSYREMASLVLRYGYDE